MNVISFKKIREFYELHSDSKKYLTSWYKFARKAKWKDFNAVRASVKTVDLIGDDCLIFNVKSNRYRLIARVGFEHQRLMIKWLGTHAEYDKIDATKV